VCMCVRGKIRSEIERSEEDDDDDDNDDDDDDERTSLSKG